MIASDMARRSSPWQSLWALAGCALLVAGATAGCGRAQHDVAPVSGQITLRGKPLADVEIVFQPVAKPASQGEAGFGSYGSTDADGRFQLKSVDGRAGAVVGKHAVRLSMRDRRPTNGDEVIGPPPKNPFPLRAYDGSLKFEVPPDGTDRADFAFP